MNIIRQNSSTLFVLEIRHPGLLHIKFEVNLALNDGYLLV